MQPLLPATEIINSANIYFDYNPPVITEPSVLTAEFSTGMPRIESPELVLAPNPTDGMLTVKLPANTIGSGVLQIRAVDGRKVREYLLTGTRTVLDVVALPAGLYTIGFSTENGTRSVSRFVRQ